MSHHKGHLASSKVTGGAERRKSAGRRKRDRLPPRDDGSLSVAGPLLVLLGRFLLMYFLYLPRARKSPPMTPELRTGGS